MRISTESEQQHMLEQIRTLEALKKKLSDLT